MAEVTYLSEKEISAFLDDLDRNKDGLIDFSEVDRKLVEVHAEIAPEAKKHNLHYGGTDNEYRRAFLREMMGTDKDQIPRAEFAERVRAWKIPTMERQKMSDKDDDDEYTRGMGVVRKIRAYWSVRGPTMVFLAMVLSFQLALGIWQAVKYATREKYFAALGWGVVLVSTSAFK